MTGSKHHGAASSAPDGEPESVIVKVTEPGYVPSGFTVRTRIDETLFTADAEPTDVAAAKHDPNVEAVDRAHRLHQP